MNRGQYLTLCAALALSVLAVVVSHRAALAVGVSPPWMLRRKSSAVL